MKDFTVKMLVLAAAVASAGCQSASFVRTSGTELLDGKGERFLIRGTNLGNWLNPEDDMLGFGSCDSPNFIDEMLRQLVGPDEAAKFRASLKDCRYENCIPDAGYLKAIHLSTPSNAKGKIHENGKQI